MSAGYDTNASKRPVNLTLNADLVRRVRARRRNLSEHVERLLAQDLIADEARRREADRAIERAIEAWNDFDARGQSFADEHSTL